MFVVVDSFDMDKENYKINKEINIFDKKSNNKNNIYNKIKSKRVIFPIIKNNKSIFEFELRLIKSLYNHSKEIKYIDFNPRLNILLSYSLDNFINIYLFPKLKLINAIDTNLFKEKNDLNYFDEVVLVSYPFPMIICHNKEYIYLLSINGEIIKSEKLEENQITFFYIDKNLGLAKDKIQIIDSNGIHIFNNNK